MLERCLDRLEGEGEGGHGGADEGEAEAEVKGDDETVGGTRFPFTARPIRPKLGKASNRQLNYQMRLRHQEDEDEDAGDDDDHDDGHEEEDKKAPATKTPRESKTCITNEAIFCHFSIPSWSSSLPSHPSVMRSSSSSSSSPSWWRRRRRG